MSSQTVDTAGAPPNASESLFKAMVDAVQDYAIFMLDAEGRVLTWNTGAERSKGYKADEIIGQHYSRFFPAHAIAEGVPAMQLREASEHGHVQEEGWRVRKDGSQFWAHVTLSAMRDEAGRLNGFAKITRDLTERRKQENILRVTMEAAETASKAKSAFLANMSHELRTPLNAIIGFSDIIRSETFGPVGNVRYRGYAKDIFTSGQHLLGLINDVLDLSKLDAGMAQLHEETIDLAELVPDTFVFLRSQAQAKEIALESVFDGPALLYADRKRLRQILINLLSNAVKFTPAKGRVTVSTAHVGAGLALRVADNGIGMATADIATAMARFGQIDSRLARKYEGTGLGLPLVREMVELHKGTMTMESAPGEGTTVTLLFPADRIVRPEDSSRLTA